MKRPILYSLFATLPFIGVGQGFSENFDDITTLDADGWTMTNQSNPLGTLDWFQGNPDAFTSHNGNDDSYIAVNFNSTADAGDISNWLITPDVTVENGDIVSFWTRTSDGSIWNDRLEVRASAGGSGVTLPSGSADVGSFTELIITINDGYDLSYPEMWTHYEYTVTGVPTPTAVQIAFRYNVINGGPSGMDSNYIGIDGLYIGNPDDQPGETGPTSYCTPTLDCTDGDLILGVTFQEIDNSSDCGSNGYSDFTSMTATVESGQSYPISVLVGDGWSNESVSVWIDYNDDFIFSQDEFTYIGTGTAAPVTGTIDIPPGLAPGAHRMRVRVAAVGESTATWDMACNTLQGYGETEDYTVVLGPVGISESLGSRFAYYPNPVNDVMTINSERPVKELTGFNLVGEQVFAAGQLTDNRVDLSNLPTGMYVFKAVMADNTMRTFKVTKH